MPKITQIISTYIPVRRFSCLLLLGVLSGFSEPSLAQVVACPPAPEPADAQAAEVCATDLSCVQALYTTIGCKVFTGYGFEDPDYVPALAIALGDGSSPQVTAMAKKLATEIAQGDNRDYNKFHGLSALAEAVAGHGQYKEAFDMATALLQTQEIRRESITADILANILLDQLDAGGPTEANAFFQIIQASNLDVSDLYAFEQAVSYLDGIDADDAYAAVQKAVEERSEYNDMEAIFARNGLLTLHRARDSRFESAFEAYTEVFGFLGMEDSPKMPQILGAQLKHLAEQGNAEEAERLVKAFLDQVPGPEGHRTVLAALYPLARADVFWANALIEQNLIEVLKAYSEGVRVRLEEIQTGFFYLAHGQ
ncbi:tetratricopeptide repeat protein [Paracoccus saliphilus]|uniref:Tetratricopeptide repeat-containing protein n=1 Tax=Paracoccus saliphilus TaxID=405559 RepID=A0AA46A4X5_9RHOB|nr:hypothetical protein [Paracoccus saliphilus]WCR05071.1 hypothetical protein JHX88_10410 [Paracoccus saliphilus]SIS70473.1 hypothetical protein SAMN05421772_103121 [Paracoccus saliphilus]